MPVLSVLEIVASLQTLSANGIQYCDLSRDDYASNFSFLLNDGKWVLSPACDMPPNPGLNHFHTTTNAGQGNPKFKEIQSVAVRYGHNKAK